MEDFFNFVETPETATIRINADAISHLGTVFSQVDDKIMKQILFEMLCKHSKFVLDTSEKMIQNRRLGINVVK